MSSAPGADGMLQEWGTRLFYGMPKKPKPSPRGKVPPAAGLAASAILDPAAVRARIRAAVHPGARQVMVKITGGGRGMKAVAAHFRYISRLGTPEAGGRGQSMEIEDERGDKLAGAEALKALQYDWRMAGTYIPDESHRREAFNIILSMPEGTPGRIVLQAARDFARETFEGHKYVFALHEDTDSPHVHLAVRAERMDGVRLNPRKADLQRWRERFAARLQDRGINAVATRAAVRGVARAPQHLWRVQGAEAGRLRKPRPALRSAASIERGRAQAAQAWVGVARALADSKSPDDQALARDVQGYVRRTFGIALTPEQRRSPRQDPGWTR